MTKLNLNVQLTGQDGNVFNLIGIVTKEMKRNGYSDQVKEFTDYIFDSGSYDEALQRIMEWVMVS